MTAKWSCLTTATFDKKKKTNTKNQHKHLIPAAKHGGGEVMIWACLAAKGPGHLPAIKWTMNYSVSQSILESDVMLSVWELNLRRSKLGHAAGPWSQAEQ